MSRKKFNYKRKLPINRYDLGSFLGITDDKGKITAGAGGIANAFAGMANTLMNPSGNTTGVGNIMSSLGSVASNIPGVGGLIGAGVNLLGGLTNAAFGSNINEAAVSNIRSNIANQAATTFDYSSSDNLLGDWSNYRDLDRIKTSDVGSDGWFNNAASNKAKQLNKQALEANLRAMANFANAANSLDILNTQAALVNYNADGGPLAMRYTGLMSPFGSRFSDGGKIYIKPSKRGTFTAAAKKRGMGVQEFASKVLANKEDYSTAMVKKANFARNFGGHKHSDGGLLEGDFSNGVIQINAGGSHSTNPYEGVQIGVDPQGIPNLVEEGELIWNDYVFSNRLKVPKAVRQKYKLREDITFAEATKKLQKESEERPNDPISKNGLNAIMSEMALTLEEIRMKKEKNKNNKFYTGGPIEEDYVKKSWERENPLIIPLIPITTNIDLPELSYDKGIDSSFNSSGKFVDIPEITFDDEGIPHYSTIKVDKKGRMSRPEDKIRALKKSNNYSSYLRYAPILNTGLSMLSDAFGITNKPDYTPIENIMDAANRASRVNKVIAPRIGNYLTYDPIDVNYLANRQSAEAAATRRAIADMSGGNRANYMANLLAADYANQSVLGDTLMKAAEANRAQKQAVEEFNRGTNTTNAEAAMRAAQINQAAEQLAKATRLSAIERAEQMRNQIDAASSAAISANRNAFFRDLGNIGREEYARQTVKDSPNTMYFQGRDGKWYYKNEDGKIVEYKDGGYLTIKNKRRRK